MKTKTDLEKEIKTLLKEYKETTKKLVALDRKINRREKELDKIGVE